MKECQKVSTSEVKQGKFRAHGLVEVTINSRIARYEAVGPFNEELLADFIVIQKQVLPEMATKGRWGDLTILHFSMMSSPSLLAKYAEDLKARALHGLAAYATAVVIGPELEGAQLMVPLIARCYSDARLLFKVFPEFTEAEAWLQSTLAFANQTIQTDAAQ